MNEPLKNKKIDYLEDILNIKVLDVNFSKESFIPSKLMTFMREKQLAEVGILFCIPNQKSIAKKLIAFVTTMITVKRYKNRLLKEKISRVEQYGVYPNIESPLIVFCLDGKANKYANQHILPQFNSNLIGCFRKIIMKLANCHPSIAGIILTVKV